MMKDFDASNVELNVYNQEMIKSAGKTPKQKSNRKMFATDNRSSINSNSKLRTSQVQSQATD